MNTNFRPAILVTGLVVMLGGSSSWGALPAGNDTSTATSNNTGGGTGALVNNTTGLFNTAYGSDALANNTTGGRNTASGLSALERNTTGSFNTAYGYLALWFNTQGGSNTASGAYALLNNTTGNNNTASGQFALGNNTTGEHNTAIGAGALGENTEANNNTASGYYALGKNTTGAANTALGNSALRDNAIGNLNTALGAVALLQSKGTFNIAIGANAGISLKRGSSNIYLGYTEGAATESKTMRLGSAQTRTFIAGIRGKRTGRANAVAVYIDSRGQLGTLNSSRRFKEDIRDMDEASRRLYELRPVTFHYKQPGEDDKPLEYGLIAEEVAKVYPDLVTYGADGQIEAVQYHKLTPMLLNEVQRLGKLLQAEKDKNLAEARELASLKQQMVSFQAQAQRMEALAVRLSRIEAVQAAGPLADARTQSKNASPR